VTQSDCEERSDVAISPFKVFEKNKKFKKTRSSHGNAPLRMTGMKGTPP